MRLYIRSLHLVMWLYFDLGYWLFDNYRYAFDVLPQLLVRFLYSRFECMASADLVDALDADSIGPAICVVHLHFGKSNSGFVLG